MTLLWSGDFSNGDWSPQWQALQDTDTNGEASVGQSQFSVVPSFRPGVQYAGKSEVFPNSNTATRAEVLTDSHMVEGSQFWYGWSYFIPSDPNASSGWDAGDHNDLTQFKNEGTGGPPVYFDIRSGGGWTPALYIQHNGVATQLIPLSEIYDKILDFAVFCKFSSDASIGYLEIWINGVQVYAKNGVTLRAGLNSYLKQGVYNTGKTNNVLLFAASARGTTRADVDPGIRFGGGGGGGTTVVGSRSFNGTTDKITALLGAASVTDALSMAVVVRQTALAPSTFLNGVDASSHVVDQFFYNSQLAFYDGAMSSFGGATLQPDVNAWQVLGVSKAAGSVIPRFHVVGLETSTRIHRGTGVAVGPATVASWVIGFTSDGPFAGLMAAVAVWKGRVLSDVEFESLLSIAAIESLAPDALWDERDGFTTDRRGGGATPTKTGTTHSDTDAPAGFWTTAAPSAPSAPTGVTATAGQLQVTVAWSAVAGATGYQVFRNGTGAGTPIYDGSALNFTDAGRTAGTTYTYTVRAYSSAGTSPASASASATAAAPPAPPTPGGLAASTDIAEVDLSWAAVADPYLTGYRLYRDGAQIYEGAARSYADTGLAAGSYDYQVSAYSQYGESAESAVVSASPVVAAPSAPASPGSIAAVGGVGVVTVSWAAVVDPYLTGYRVYRDGAIVYDGVDLTFADQDVVAGTTYDYQVSAYSPYGESPRTGVASATPTEPTPPPPPLGFRPLSDRTREMLEERPPALRDDPDIQAVTYCYAQESERIESTLASLRAELNPLTATDLGLSWFELSLKLTVRPPGQLLEARRQTILAYLRRQNLGASGLDWEAAVTKLIGPGWTYEEHDPDDPTSPAAYVVRITLPFPPSSDIYARVRRLIRDVTPAHIEIAITSGEGFVLDQSQLDEEPLTF